MKRPPFSSTGVPRLRTRRSCNFHQVARPVEVMRSQRLLKPPVEALERAIGMRQSMRLDRSVMKVPAIPWRSISTFLTGVASFTARM